MKNIIRIELANRKPLIPDLLSLLPNGGRFFAVSSSLPGVSFAVGVLEALFDNTITMPGERRNLRSNKETSSSTNGEKARSNSTSSGSSKDKPVPTKATSSKSKAVPSKKPSGKEADGDRPQTNGTEPAENGVNGTKDVDMVDDGPEKIKIGTNKDGEDEMTVVVPPPKGVKLSGEPGKDADGDVAMDNTVSAEHVSQEAEVDPKVKAIAG